MQSILVIRLSSMGDVILATPLIRQLQHTYPDAIIDVAVASRFAGVHADNPRIRKVWKIEPRTSPDPELDDVKLAMRESVPGGHYDLVVDLQNNFRSAALRKGIGRDVVRAPKHRLEKLALVYLKRRPRPITPIVARYRRPVAHLPLAFDSSGPEVWLPEERTLGYYPPDARPATVRGRIAVAPGAHHATKRWPAVRFAELCRRLVEEQGLVPVLVGGPDDRELCDGIAASSGVPVERADGIGSIQDTARVLDTCDAIITNDTGVMHLASARRLPVVAIFGSTVPELGFAPYGVRHVIVQHDLGCRPCSHIGRASCPKGHFLCMNGISVQEVLEALQKP